ncbi:MAG TPA: ABC transporter permease [Rugosimonospora sp.]|nr:ABC transporter permease [Rugosimonospora sp.]
MEFLLFAVLGLGFGALIAGLALGVVLNFRGAGVVNLGLGGAATIGAYLFYGLRTGGYVFLPAIGALPDRIQLGGPWPIPAAFGLSVLIIAAFGALFDIVALRRLRAAPALAKLVTTLGLLMIAQAVVSERFGTTGLPAPAVLTDATLRLFGTNVPQSRPVLAVLVAAVTALLVAVYRWTRFGLRTRAAAENETAALLTGLSPDRLSLVNTTAAFAIAAALGILAAPVTQLDPTVLSDAIVPALGAALLASFTSFTIAAAAGLAMGMAQSLVTYLQSMPWFPTSDSLPLKGVADLVFFAVIGAAVALRGKRLPQRGTVIAHRLPKAPRPQRIARPAATGAVLAAAGLLLLPYGGRQAITFTLIALISCLAIIVLVGYAGQLSLVQTALAGVAGFATSRLAVQAGIGFPLGPLLGVAAATGLGLLVALPALRVRGVHLAIVTMAAAVALNTFGFSNPTWGASSQGSPVPEPRLFGLDLGPAAGWLPGYRSLPSPVFGLACLACAVPLAMLVASLRRSHLGQRMLAVRDNERAAAAAGINVARVKLTAFGISAFLAGIAGVLYAYNYGSVSGASYTLALGLSFIAFVLTFGVGSVSGAVAASLGAVQGVIIYTVNLLVHVSTNLQLILGGVMLILTIMYHPDGITVDDKKGPPPPLNLLTALLRRIRETTP